MLVVRCYVSLFVFAAVCCLIVCCWLLCVCLSVMLVLFVFGYGYMLFVVVFVAFCYYIDVVACHI